MENPNKKINARQYIYKIEDSANQLKRGYEFTSPLELRLAASGRMPTEVNPDTFSIVGTAPTFNSSGKINFSYSEKGKNHTYSFGDKEYSELFEVVNVIEMIEKRIRNAFVKKNVLEMAGPHDSSWFYFEPKEEK